MYVLNTKDSIVFLCLVIVHITFLQINNYAINIKDDKVYILSESQLFCNFTSEPPFFINSVRPMNVYIKNLERNITLTYFIIKTNLDLSKTQFVKVCNKNYIYI